MHAKFCFTRLSLDQVIVIQKVNWQQHSAAIIIIKSIISNWSFVFSFKLVLYYITESLKKHFKAQVVGFSISSSIWPQWGLLHMVLKCRTRLKKLHDIHALKNAMKYILSCTIDAWAFKGTATGYISHVPQ